MGRGDKRTAKGKRFKHSFGNSRPKTKGETKPPVVPKAKATTKKK